MVKPMNDAVIMATTIPMMKFRIVCALGGRSTGRGLMCGWLNLARQPTHSVRLHGVYGKTKFFGSVASGALKRALLKTPLSGRDARKPHPVFTGRTHGPLAVNTHHSVPRIVRD